MSAIQNDWLEPLQKEFQKPYYRDLFSKVKEEYNTTTVYPPAEDLFNAFHMTPFSKVKVGNYSYGELNVVNFSNEHELRIGNYVSIAQNVAFLLDVEHHTDYISTFPVMLSTWLTS